LETDEKYVNLNKKLESFMEMQPMSIKLMVISQVEQMMAGPRAILWQTNDELRSIYEKLRNIFSFLRGVISTAL
jgi:hypothetical protein